MVFLPRYEVVGVFFILLNNARNFSHVISKKDRKNERCSSLNLPPGLGRHLPPSPRCDCGILGQAGLAIGYQSSVLKATLDTSSKFSPAQDAVVASLAGSKWGMIQRNYLTLWPIEIVGSDNNFNKEIFIQNANTWWKQTVIIFNSCLTVLWIRVYQ